MPILTDSRGFRWLDQPEPDRVPERKSLPSEFRKTFGYGEKRRCEHEWKTYGGAWKRRSLREAPRLSNNAPTDPVLRKPTAWPLQQELGRSRSAFAWKSVAFDLLLDGFPSDLVANQESLSWLSFSNQSALRSTIIVNCGSVPPGADTTPSYFGAPNESACG